jgi:hypothetical protein
MDDEDYESERNESEDDESEDDKSEPLKGKERRKKTGAGKKKVGTGKDQRMEIKGEEELQQLQKRMDGIMEKLAKPRIPTGIDPTGSG